MSHMSFSPKMWRRQKEAASEMHYQEHDNMGCTKDFEERPASPPTYNVRRQMYSDK